MLFLIFFIPFYRCKIWGIIITNRTNSFRATGFKPFNQARNRLCFVLVFVIVMIKKLHKNPLSPFIVSWVRRSHFSTPIITEAQIFKLSCKCLYILFSRYGWVLARLNCVLLGWKSKTIKPHWVQNVETFQSFVSTYYVCRNVAERMANMKPSTRRIGKHI